jgi:preprotein translocase subunit SecG
MRIFLTVLQVAASIGLICSILLQSGKSAGMSGAIAGGAEQLFGKKKGLDQIFSKISTIFAMSFLLLSLILSIVK